MWTDWLIGSEVNKEFLDRRSYSLEYEAPIVKLGEAILLQAISDKAERVEFYQRATTESEQLAELERRNELVEQSKSADKSQQYYFQVVLADLENPPAGRLLEVIFVIGGNPIQAMTIPIVLCDPLIRHYRYKFNYDMSTDSEAPENLIYLEVRASARAAYLSIGHYKPRASFLLAIDLDPEEQEEK
jgi:hypothetical protein